MSNAGNGVESWNNLFQIVKTTILFSNNSLLDADGKWSNLTNKGIAYTEWERFDLNFQSQFLTYDLFDGRIISHPRDTNYSLILINI